MKKSLLLLASALLWAATVQATPITYQVALSGPAEAPPNASPGTGAAIIIVDAAAHTLSVDVTFSGLLGNTTASHIHCCTLLPGTGAAGVATQVPTFTGFPLGVTAGSYASLPRNAAQYGADSNGRRASAPHSAPRASIQPRFG